MPSVATRRLIDAVATLDPADRALLNLWINRALPDDELLRLTRLSPGTLATRRERIVDRLGESLGLPGPDVTAALAALALGDPPPDEPPAVEPPAPAPAPAAAVATESEPARPSRWPIVLSVLGLVGLVAAIIAGLALSSRSARTALRPPAVARAAVVTLSPLPGGPAGARGTVTIRHRGPTLTLDLTVSSPVPPPSGGHYEAWLYSSVIDSSALGPIDTSTGRLSVRLPGGASRYPWIDVSVQPAGTTVHSGISVLRAANPLARRVSPPGAG